MESEEEKGNVQVKDIKSNVKSVYKDFPFDTTSF